MKKGSQFWKCSALFLLGIVIGFLCSPVKHGFSIGCNNRDNGVYNTEKDGYSDKEDHTVS